MNNFVDGITRYHDEGIEIPHELLDGEGNGNKTVYYNSKNIVVGKVYRKALLKPSPLSIKEAFDLPADHEEMCIVCLGSGPKGKVTHLEKCPYTPNKDYGNGRRWEEAEEGKY